MSLANEHPFFLAEIGQESVKQLRPKSSARYARRHSMQRDFEASGVNYILLFHACGRWPTETDTSLAGTAATGESLVTPRR